MIQFDLRIFFQMGWNNHQPKKATNLSRFVGFHLSRSHAWLVSIETLLWNQVLAKLTTPKHRDRAMEELVPISAKGLMFAYPLEV